MISDSDIRQRHTRQVHRVSHCHILLLYRVNVWFISSWYFSYLWPQFPSFINPSCYDICFSLFHICWHHYHIDACVQERRDYIANAPELLLLLPNTLVMLLQYIFPIDCTHVIVVLCFVVVLFLVPNGFMWSIPMIFRVSSLALRQYQDFPNVKEATQKYMVKI